MPQHPQRPHHEPNRPHHETGISDEAAVEAHDLIDHAEEEEHSLHEHISNESTTQANMENLGKTMPTGGSAEKKSGLDKVKEALNMK